jgi:hypothetical protein
MSRKATISVVIVFLIMIIGGAIYAFTGKIISTDLSVIGEGRPVAVLAAENYSPAGMQAMDQINVIMEDFEDQVLFRVASIGSPNGDRFVAEHGIRDGVLVVLGGDGTVLDKWAVVDDTDTLARKLATALN